MSCREQKSNLAFVGSTIPGLETAVLVSADCRVLKAPALSSTSLKNSLKTSHSRSHRVNPFGISSTIRDCVLSECLIDAAKDKLSRLAKQWRSLHRKPWQPVVIHRVTGAHFYAKLGHQRRLDGCGHRKMIEHEKERSTSLDPAL